jgi:ribose 5-phosphate isomerase RpiB
MRVAIAADHGGIGMKEQLAKKPAADRHQGIDFGNIRFAAGDDYPDIAIPLAPATLRHDDYSARHGVEDDDSSILCLHPNHRNTRSSGVYEHLSEVRIKGKEKWN